MTVRHKNSFRSKFRLQDDRNDVICLIELCKSVGRRGYHGGGCARRPLSIEECGVAQKHLPISKEDRLPYLAGACRDNYVFSKNLSEGVVGLYYSSHKISLD